MIIEANVINSKVYIYTGILTAKKHDLHKSVSSILFMALCSTSGNCAIFLKGGVWVFIEFVVE